MNKLMVSGFVAVAAMGTAFAVTVSDLAGLREAVADGAVTEIEIAANTTLDVSSDGNGPVVLNRAMTLSGANRDTSVLSGGNATNCLRVVVNGVTIRNLTIKDGFGGHKSGNYVYGGGVYLSGAGTVMTNCVVRDCHATVDIYLRSGAQGGGIYMTGACKLVDCTVTGCKVGYVGTTKQDQAYVYGGGVYATSGATVERCEIVGNVCYDAYLHMVYDNIQTCSGGGIYLGGGSTCTASVVSCNVCSNNYETADIANVWQSGGHGGGVYIGSAATLTDCVIEGNVATRYGGGVCVQSGTSKVLVDGCTMRTNAVILYSTKESSNLGGGAIRVSGSAVTLSNCLIEDCWSTYTGTSAGNYNPGLGGGIAVDGLTGTSEIRGCVIRNCHAYNGGGMACLNGGSSATIRDCVFDGNKAGWASGAVRVATFEDLLFERCIFKDNSCPSMASVCWLSQPSLAGKHCRFRNSFFTGNTGAAVLYLQNYTRQEFVNIDQCTFVNNTGQTAVSFDWDQSNTNTYVHGCLFYGNGSDIATGNNDYPLSATTNVTYSYVGTWDAKFPVDTEKQALHNYNSSMLSAGITAQFRDAANGDFRLVRKAELRGKGGDAEAWMGTGKRGSTLDCGDGTWTEEKVATISVKGKSYDVGAKLTFNNAVPRVYGTEVDMGCFQYYAFPGLLLLVK